MIFKILNPSKAEKEQDPQKHLLRVSEAWQQNEKKILDNFNKRTNLSINTDKITCYINFGDTHGYYGEDEIWLGIVDEDTETDIMVIAHELFHIYYWKKIKEDGLTKSEMGKEPLSEWCLTEATVFLLQSELKYLWPNAKISLPEDAKNLYSKIKGFWEKETFDNYLKKSYEVLKDES